MGHPPPLVPVAPPLVPVAPPQAGQPISRPPVPAVYEEQQGVTAVGRPMGIHCPGVVLNAPLEAIDGGAGASSKRISDPVA